MIVGICDLACSCFPVWRCTRVKTGSVIMHLTECHAPHPSRVGQYRDLTKSSVKFPSSGAKKLVKTPLCPGPP